MCALWLTVAAHLLCSAKHSEPLWQSAEISMPYNDLSERCCISLLSTVCSFLGLFRTQRTPRVESLGVIRGAMQTWDPLSSFSFLFSPQSFLQKSFGGLKTLGISQSRRLESSNSPNNPPFLFFTNVQMEASSRK